METHWKKLTNPNYLGSYSLTPGQDLTVTITKVVQEDVMNMNGKKEKAIVAYLQGHKPVILNKTNCKTISKMYDNPYIENWAGKQITFYAAKVDAFGEKVEALRIRPTVPISKKPELNEMHPKWNAAIDSLSKGNTTIATIKKTYDILPEVEDRILTLIKK